jgi:hypothetical protein
MMAKLPSGWTQTGLPPMTGGARPAVNPEPIPLMVRRPVAKQPGSDQDGPVPKLKPVQPNTPNARLPKFGKVPGRI